MVKTVSAVFRNHGRELPFALYMSAGFFLSIAVFWILKPLKKGLFIETFHDTGVSLAGYSFSAAKAEIIAKEFNLIVAIVAMAFFTALARRFQKHTLLCINTSFLILLSLLFAGVLNFPGTSAIPVWLFYIFGDLFNMLMLASFFAFLNDVVSVSQSKRLYGIVVFGGVLGGAFGSTVLRTWLDILSLSSWLLICALAMAAIIGFATAAGRYLARHPGLFCGNVERLPVHADATVFSEGGRAVARSRHLISIAIIVAMYEMVSSIIDYQFTESVSAALSGAEIGRHFATTYMVMNIVALVVQLFFARLLMTRLGVGRTIVILPLLLLIGSGSFFAFPGLMIGTFLVVCDNGLNYSLHQSCKESLYVIAQSNEKYAGKAFIDIFVQRMAKGVGLMIPIVASVSMLRWLSLLSIPLIALWVAVANRAGRTLDQSDGERDARAEEKADEAA